MTGKAKGYVPPPKTDLTDQEILVRCQDAMMRIGLNLPQFLIVYSRVKGMMTIVRDSKKCPTMAIAATGRIYINADFAASLQTDEIGGILCHEMMHLVLMHHERTGLRDKVLFNVAQDMVINHALNASGKITLPNWALYPPKEYDGDMYAEALYDWLLNNQPNANNSSKQKRVKAGANRGKGQGGTGQGGDSSDDEDDYGDQNLPGAGCGVNEDDSDDQNSAGQGKSTVDWRIVAAEMAAMSDQLATCNGAGAGSEAIARLLSPREPKVNWASILRRGIGIASHRKFGRDAQTLAKRNRRSPSVGPQMPGWIGVAPVVCVIADISGSMGEEFVSRLFAECKSLLSKSDELKMFFITHTSQVEWSGWIDRSNSQKMIEAVNFTGGTDPEPAYELARQKFRKFDAIIHFTDAEFSIDSWPEYNASQLIVGMYGNGGTCQPPPGAIVIKCFIDT